MGVAHPPLAAPGDHHEYNNTGYILAGQIVEAVTGNSLREEIDARIVRPLKLEHTELANRPRIDGPHAHGYMPIDGKLVDVTGVSPSWAWSAGALVSTADDLARFYRALKNGRLLERREMAAMRTTVPSGGQERYGLAYWHTKLVRCGAWGHDGDLPGYHADAFTHGDRVVVLLATRSGDDGGMRTLRAGFRVLNAALCR
jgi:D-alanyl-D-alanine carboxypeptidase